MKLSQLSHCTPQKNLHENQWQWYTLTRPQALANKSKIMNYRLLLFVHTFAICHSIIGAELPAKRALTESAAKEAYFKAKEQLYQSCNSVLQAIKDEERYEYDNISKQEKTERMPLQIWKIRFNIR